MDLLQAVLGEKYLLARCSPFLCCARLLVLPRLPFPIVPAVVVLCLLCSGLHVALVSIIIAWTDVLDIHVHPFLGTIHTCIGQILP